MEEIEFENQRPHEKVIIMEHQHPWVLAKAIFLLITLAVLILLGFFIWKTSLFSFLILAAGFIFAIIYVSSRWFVYTNNLFILTNERIICISQKSLFDRKVSEIEIGKIYNLTYEIKGFWKSLLNFGNIKIFTSGDEESIIVLKDYENPHFIHEKITEFQNRAPKG